MTSESLILEGSWLQREKGKMDGTFAARRGSSRNKVANTLLKMNGEQKNQVCSCTSFITISIFRATHKFYTFTAGGKVIKITSVSAGIAEKQTKNPCE